MSTVNSSDGYFVTPLRLVTKLVDETIQSDTALTLDSELFFDNLPANHTFQYFVFFLWDSDATADLKCSITGPSVSSGRITTFNSGFGADTGALDGNNFLDGDGIGTTNAQNLSALLTTSAVGTVGLTWSQTTTQALDTTVFKDSFAYLWDFGAV